MVAVLEAATISMDHKTMTIYGYSGAVFGTTLCVRTLPNGDIVKNIDIPTRDVLWDFYCNWLKLTPGGPYSGFSIEKVTEEEARNDGPVINTMALKAQHVGVRRAWYSPEAVAKGLTPPIVYKKLDGSLIAVTNVEDPDSPSLYHQADKIDCGLVVRHAWRSFHPGQDDHLIPVAMHNRAVSDAECFAAAQKLLDDMDKPANPRLVDMPRKTKRKGCKKCDHTGFAYGKIPCECMEGH